MRSLKDFKSRQERLEYLQKIFKKKFEEIGRVRLEGEFHCENVIGGTVLPLGVAGPVVIKSMLKGREKEVFIPLATTEGALVASVNRGCKAAFLSGKIKVLVEKVGTTRGPVFYLPDLEKGIEFKAWLKKNFARIKQVAEKTSSHLKLLHYEFFFFVPYVFVRFYFDTDKAMGMNMATIATSKIVELIKKEFGIDCLSLSGNFCVDKKPAFLNFLLGRGYKAWAEAKIKRQVCRQVLKVEPEQIVQVWLAKNMAGSSFSGSIGFNAHFANIVAAFFAAVGQDLAHTVEGSLGASFATVEGEELYFSVYLPALMLGVVGGGTKLKVKKEAMSIAGAKTPEDLAEALSAAVLAGELSLLASLAEGSLALAHKKFGR